MIFPSFYQWYPELDYEHSAHSTFSNDDSVLQRAVSKALATRSSLGLQGIVGDLACIHVNVAKDELTAAVDELCGCTGYKLSTAFQNVVGCCAVLKCMDSADILITTRNHAAANPFTLMNSQPKTMKKPAARLETFVFECLDLRKYVDAQKARGVRFMTQDIIVHDDYLFIQTEPSDFTGNSTGFLQWTRFSKNYSNSTDITLTLDLKANSGVYLGNIGRLDHAATRVKAFHRDSALIEFMELTNYDFAFAIYVNSLNSITNVARLDGARYAAVFTSGIKPFVSLSESGPTELFIHNYGTRVHHLAFETEDIDYTYNSLKKNGYGFLSELVGSEEKGIRQAFSQPSPHTFLVNEYISRYGDFDGFFIEENVTLLTKATENQ